MCLLFVPAKVHVGGHTHLAQLRAGKSCVSKQSTPAEKGPVGTSEEEAVLPQMHTSVHEYTMNMGM